MVAAFCCFSRSSLQKPQVCLVQKQALEPMAVQSPVQESDLTIFKKESAVCIDSDYTKCAAINRLAVALKYYSK